MLEADAMEWYGAFCELDLGIIYSTSLALLTLSKVVLLCFFHLITNS